VVPLVQVAQAVRLAAVALIPLAPEVVLELYILVANDLSPLHELQMSKK